jgi:hypothetical protein
MFLTYIIILVIVCDCYVTSNRVLIRKIIVSCVPMKAGCVQAANLSETIRIKRPFFWDITLCSMLKVSLRFGGTYRLHQVAQRSACKIHAVFLRDLFIDHEDGGDMFLRNVCRLSTDYTALYPR